MLSLTKIYDFCLFLDWSSLIGVDVIFKILLYLSTSTKKVFGGQSLPPDSYRDTVRETIKKADEWKVLNIYLLIRLFYDRKGKYIIRSSLMNLRFPSLVRKAIFLNGGNIFLSFSVKKFLIVTDCSDIQIHQYCATL